MEPALHDGDWILAVTGGRIGIGDVVVLERPDRPGLLVVKRVADVRPDGYWVLGDAPTASTDSRQFGAVPDLIARVVWRVRPWGPILSRPSDLSDPPDQSDSSDPSDASEPPEPSEPSGPNRPPEPSGEVGRHD